MQVDHRSRKRLAAMTPAADSLALQARWMGLIYLAIIGLGLYSELGVRGNLVVPRDAAATAAHIAAAPLLWRSGLVADLLMQVLDVPLIVFFYRLLRPAGESMALSATLLNAVQTAVLVADRSQQLMPLFVLGDDAYLHAFSAAQLHALSQLAIRMHGHGFGIGLVYFGAACVLRGMLIVRSGILPRPLGVLLGAAGISYLVNSLALLLAPALADALFPGVLLPALIGESALCLWLLLRGERALRWPNPTAEA